jgi:hypothetical protein
MSSMISLPSEISVSKLEFGPVKVLDSGGKSVNIRYEGRNLMIETPSLNVPYGVNKYDKTPGAPVKYSIDLSFRGADDNEEIRALQDFLEAFDERMIDAGIENADKWFKMKSPSREVIKAFYTPLVKVSVDKEGNPKPYPPTFKLALRKRIAKKGESPDPSENVRAFETKFYNAQEKDTKGAIAEFDGSLKIDELLPKRSQVGAIIQCTGIWFAGGKYGTTWKVVQLRVDSQPEQIRGPAFRSEAPDIRAFTSRMGAGAGAGYEGYGGDEYDDAGIEDSVVAAALPVAKPKAAAAAVAAPAPAPTFDEEAVTEPIAVPVKAKVAAAPAEGGEKKKKLVPKAKATA